MIVVTGATGNVGQPLVHALAEAGEQVIAVSRGRTPADVPAGVEFRQADLTRPAQLASVFDGADALFLMDTGSSAHMISVRGILDDARASRIARVVMLSSVGVVTRPESQSHGVMMRSAEDAVLGSGMEWTILRPGGFASNAFAWAESVRTRRVVAAPFGDIGLPVIDPADIAGVAAVALRQPGHAGSIYELTGPARITPRQQAAVISDALGEPVRFVEQTREQAREQMLRYMPGAVADTTLDALGAPTPAELRIGSEVEQVLRRPARTFADWTRRHLTAFQ